MSILKLFSGPTPEKLEKKGDALFDARRWGQAKQAYDHALHKLEKHPGQHADDRKSLSGKIRQTRDALAREHRQNAENYIAGEYFDEARDMLALALEIAEDPQFKKELRDRLDSIAQKRHRETIEEPTDYWDETEQPDDMAEPLTDDAYFDTLCALLPQEVQDAYFGYGEDFKTGYIALNRGDFQTAALHLSRALKENLQPESYIPLELAAASLNLGRLAEARELLEGFLQHHPDALPAYQLLCEILWEQKDFPQVDALLSDVPDDLAESLALALLKGETFLRSGDFKAARDYYQDILDTYGWNDTVAGELAKTYEKLDEPARAGTIYEEMMDRCTGCHARVDPAVKHRYAEICFAGGRYDSDLLEMYISLAREIPDNAAQYFDRISRMYDAQGNTGESERFRSFAVRAESERD